MTLEEQRTLDLFEAVELRTDINQRQLAEATRYFPWTGQCVSQDNSQQGMDSCT